MNEDKSWQLAEPKLFDQNAIWIREGEELIGEWSEKLFCIGGRTSNNEVDTHCSIGELMQYACCGFENPCTFVSERIDNYRCKMKSSEPFTQRAGVALQWVEHGVEGR